MSIQLVKQRGFLGLFGPEIDEIARTALATDALQGSPLVSSMPYHITLLTKKELQMLATSGVEPPMSTFDLSSIHPLGVGRCPGTAVYYVVVIWVAGQTYRKALRLPPKHFHITLSPTDDHTFDKDVGSLLHNQFPDSSNPNLLDHLAYTCQLFQSYAKAQEYASLLIAATPRSHRGYVRLGDASALAEEHKLAMLSYAQGFEYTDDAVQVQEYCVRKMVKLSSKTEWGLLFQEHELDQVDKESPHSAYVLKPWKKSLRQVISDMHLSPILSLEPRVSLHIPIFNQDNRFLQFRKLPRFFRWIVPFYLAVMSTPRDVEDIAALSSSALGIRHILTLTEETPLQAAWFERNPRISNTFLPISNYYPPSIELQDNIMGILDDQDDGPFLIHCGGGKGRAGTVVACYLVAHGFQRPSFEQDNPAMSASEAVKALRALRPGSIETAQQEDFVSKWCSTIWRRQQLRPVTLPEPLPCSLEIEGDVNWKEANLFILVGLPGSGKSWLSSSILARNPSGWIQISQDSSGSRAFCETQIGHDPHGCRVLLDRCNVSALDRRSWLSLASNWSRHPVCIWLDYDRELCLSRAQRRSGHPTLRPGSQVNNAMSQMHSMFERPELQEGFQSVVVVKSFAAAEELVRKLSHPLGIFKYPRTPHLLNLGAATEDDLVSSDMPTLQGKAQVIITEKVDGANMGFSLSSDRSHIVVQNRSHYVNMTSHEQFKKLGLWLERHEIELKKLLGRDSYFPERYVLFGEWLYATHSIPYTSIPDTFMAFDLYDRATGTFASRRILSILLQDTTISMVPVLNTLNVLPSSSELRSMVQQPSMFWDGPVEGVYVKTEDIMRVLSRAKVVRGDFIAGNEHWSRGALKVNGLDQAAIAY